jgi:hypothetical protein
VDGYLTKYALSDEVAGVTRTYVVNDTSEAHPMVGYVSIFCDAIRLSKEERPTDHPGAPAVKIGLMGVRQDFRKRKFQERSLGCWILDWVVGLTVDKVLEVAGVRYITLDSLPEPKLVAWYERYGFKKNVEEEYSRKILKQARRASLKNKPLSEIDLPHISMRFDIRLKPNA